MDSDDKEDVDFLYTAALPDSLSLHSDYPKLIDRRLIKRAVEENIENRIDRIKNNANQAIKDYIENNKSLTNLELLQSIENKFANKNTPNMQQYLYPPMTPIGIPQNYPQVYPQQYFPTNYSTASPDHLSLVMREILSSGLEQKKQHPSSAVEPLLFTILSQIVADNIKSNEYVMKKVQELTSIVKKIKEKYPKTRHITGNMTQNSSKGKNKGLNRRNNLSLDAASDDSSDNSGDVSDADKDSDSDSSFDSDSSSSSSSNPGSRGALINSVGNSSQTQPIPQNLIKITTSQLLKVDTNPSVQFKCIWKNSFNKIKPCIEFLDLSVGVEEFKNKTVNLSTGLIDTKPFNFSNEIFRHGGVLKYTEATKNKLQNFLREAIDSININNSTSINSKLNDANFSILDDSDKAVFGDRTICEIFLKKKLSTILDSSFSSTKLDGDFKKILFLLLIGFNKI